MTVGLEKNINLLIKFYLIHAAPAAPHIKESLNGYKLFSIACGRGRLACKLGSRINLTHKGDIL